MGQLEQLECNQSVQVPEHPSGHGRWVPMPFRWEPEQESWPDGPGLVSMPGVTPFLAQSLTHARADVRALAWPETD